MLTYISLLRGINVSGQKMIKMADLKVLYETLGFVNVETYIQSGNVIFEYQKTEASKLQEMIFDKIQSHFGFEVSNLILTPNEIENALTNNPYQNIEKMYFIFLNEIPKQENIDLLKNLSFENEFFELKEKVLFAHYPNGAGRAKMNNNFIERKLKVRATSRNLNTVKKLYQMTS